MEDPVLFRGYVSIKERTFFGYKKRFIIVDQTDNSIRVYKNDARASHIYSISLRGSKLSFINRKRQITIYTTEKRYIIRATETAFKRLSYLLPPIAGSRLHAFRMFGSTAASTNDILSLNSTQPMASSTAFGSFRKSRVSLDNFRKIAVIGRGNFGKVTLVQKMDTGKYYAMKSIQKGILLKSGQHEGIIAEKIVLMRVENPFIVRLHFSFQSKERLYFILDYVAGGDLYTNMKKYGLPDEWRTKIYIAETILAIQHLHKLGIVYRDLKTENILIDADGHLKLSDFGLSRVDSEDNFEFSQHYKNSLCGTIEYLAPEVIFEEPYGPEVDWWGIGILLYEMSFGLPPFYDRSPKKMVRKIIQDRVHIPPGTDKALANLLIGLLEKNPKQRLGSAEMGGVDRIKSHRYFRGLDWADVEKKKYSPGFTPKIESSTDTQNFESEFTKLSLGDSVPEVSILSAKSDMNVFDGFSFDRYDESLDTDLAIPDVSSMLADNEIWID